MSSPIRGERLQRLISLGCSTRGLGAELGKSATTIRRHMVIAGLPAADRRAIEGGASAKGILKLKETADRIQRIQARVDKDQKKGAISDQIASIILWFCHARKEFRRS